MQEILLIDKPAGITSYDVIRILQRKMGRLKMGHAGTLDPMATGLMIIGIGAGTKKLNDYLKLPKTYEAEITLGVRTDTSDITGTVLEKYDLNSDDSELKLVINEEKIKQVLISLIGKNDLPVSIYSALKKAGKPLYEYAREGKDVEIPMRTMTVNRIEFISFNNTEYKIKAIFDVESGTYIRSLAEEIGKRLGTVATLSELRRTRIGEFYVKDAELLE
jgi:tRNA pseudouridine55 synthase